MEMDDKLKTLKMKYLFDDDTGLIRQGLSMAKYARILQVESEDELDDVVMKILEEEGFSSEEE